MAATFLLSYSCNGREKSEKLSKKINKIGEAEIKIVKELCLFIAAQAQYISLEITFKSSPAIL